MPDTLKSFTFHETRGFDKYGDFMIELSDLQKNLDLIVQAAWKGFNPLFYAIHNPELKLWFVEESYSDFIGAILKKTV